MAAETVSVVVKQLTLLHQIVAVIVLHTINAVRLTGVQFNVTLYLTYGFGFDETPLPAFPLLLCDTLSGLVTSYELHVCLLDGIFTGRLLATAVSSGSVVRF